MKVILKSETQLQAFEHAISIKIHDYGVTITLDIPGCNGFKGMTLDDDWDKIWIDGILVHNTEGGK